MPDGAALCFVGAAAGRGAGAGKKAGDCCFHHKPCCILIFYKNSVHGLFCYEGDLTQKIM